MGSGGGETNGVSGISARIGLCVNAMLGLGKGFRVTDGVNTEMSIAGGVFVCVGSTGVGEVADVQADRQNARAIKARIDLFILLPIRNPSG